MTGPIPSSGGNGPRSVREIRRAHGFPHRIHVDGGVSRCRGHLICSMAAILYSPHGFHPIARRVETRTLASSISSSSVGAAAPIAEYGAAAVGLRLAIKHGLQDKAVLVLSDHSSLISHMRGESKAREDKEYYPLLMLVRNLARGFYDLRWVHISRLQNRAADRLAAAVRERRLFPTLTSPALDSLVSDFSDTA